MSSPVKSVALVTSCHIVVHMQTSNIMKLHQPTRQLNWEYLLYWSRQPGQVQPKRTINNRDKLNTKINF